MFGFNNLQTTLIAAVIAFLLGAASAGTVVYRYEEATWTAAIEKQKREAAELLQVKTLEVAAIERGRAAVNAQLERDHEDHRNRIEAALADNRRLADQLGGLRDPGRRPGGCRPVPGAAGSAGPAQDGSAEGGLSAEASRFLLEFAAEADRAAEYAGICREWAGNLNGHPRPTN